MNGHRSRLCYFTIDVGDLDAGVAFWSAALDAEAQPVSKASRHLYRQMRLPDSEIWVLLQATDDKKVSKERMHLDLETDDVDAEVRASQNASAPLVGTTSKSAASTSGSCETPGETSSASSKQSSPSCSLSVGHGQTKRRNSHVDNTHRTDVANLQ